MKGINWMKCLQQCFLIMAFGLSNCSCNCRCRCPIFICFFFCLISCCNTLTLNLYNYYKSNMEDIEEQKPNEGFSLWSFMDALFSYQMVLPLQTMPCLHPVPHHSMLIFTLTKEKLSQIFLLNIYIYIHRVRATFKDMEKKNQCNCKPPQMFR